MFENPHWKMFFSQLRGSFAIPTPSALAGDPLHDEYSAIMHEVLRRITQWNLICITLDGATNVLGKQVINLMACGPLAFFLEHFNMELRRESAAHLFDKLVDCKHRLRASIRQPIDGFSVAPTNEDDDVELAADGDEDIVLRIATLDKQFKNTPVFCVCSDSPSVMVALHRRCMESKEFLFAFGCTPHALQNFCMDLIKKFEEPRLIVKNLILMVKGIRSVHMIFALFCGTQVQSLRRARWVETVSRAARLTATRPNTQQLPQPQQGR
jgi:hypothetical protein